MAVICCPVCSKWFKRENDKYFCSPACRTEAFKILDTPETFLIEKFQYAAEENFTKRMEREKHHYKTVIAGLEAELERLKEENLALKVMMRLS
jgi:hypothetical protein